MPSTENSTHWARSTLRFGLSRLSVGQYGRRLLLAKSLVGGPESWVLIAEDGDGQQRGVDRACFADCQGSDRNAARHLHHTQERIQAVKRVRLHGHAENREERLAGTHSGQMRGSAGAGNQDLESPLGGTAGVFEKQVGCPMRTHDGSFKGNPERGQLFRCVFHGFPVGLAAHDNPNQRHWCHTHRLAEFPAIRQADGTGVSLGRRRTPIARVAERPAAAVFCVVFVPYRVTKV